MKTDIFEDTAYWIDCDNSNLSYRKRKAWKEIKRWSLLVYPVEQLQKFSHYLFDADDIIIKSILEEVVCYRRNASLYSQSWKIQRG